MAAPIEVPYTRFKSPKVIACVQAHTVNKPCDFDKTAVNNWMDDLMQIAPGPGAIALTIGLDPSNHACPRCGSTTEPKLMHVPECAYWGLDYSCACGADYSGEDLGDWNRLEKQHAPEVLIEHQQDFAHWVQRAAPIGTEPVYDENQISLLGVRLTDGQTVLR